VIEVNTRSKATLEEISDWFKNDELFFLIGAGFSSSSTESSIGTGKQLAHYLSNIIDNELKDVSKDNIEKMLNELLIDHNKEEKIEEIIKYIDKVIKKDNINLKNICDRIITEKSQKDYEKIIQKYFDDRSDLILQTHKNMIPVIEKKEKAVKNPLIVSLNIDQLIERAYLINSKGMKNVPCYIGGLSKDNFSKLETSLIWKFHGCVTDMDTAVFSTFSYYKFKREHKESMTNLKRLFRNKHCVMLGVSLEDDHIRDLIFELYENSDMPQSVIVSPKNYLNEQFLDYMNEFISLAYFEDEISDFLEKLNALI
jgi:hypothetical protein